MSTNPSESLILSNDSKGNDKLSCENQLNCLSKEERKTLVGHLKNQVMVYGEVKVSFNSSNFAKWLQGN